MEKKKKARFGSFIPQRMITDQSWKTRKFVRDSQFASIKYIRKSFTRLAESEKYVKKSQKPRS